MLSRLPVASRPEGGAKRLFALLVLCLVLAPASTLLAKFDSAAWSAKLADASEQDRLRSAFVRCREQANAPASNLSIPLEMYEDGRIKTQLVAGKAQMFLDSGFVWGEDIKVEQFDERGALSGSLTAASCVVDRKKLTGWVEGAASATLGGVTVKGDGIFFDFKDEFVKIASRAEITVRSVHIDFGRLL